MISKYEAFRQQVEDAVHNAYASLADYARTDKANPKAVYVRQKMLDTFADGWNAAELEIERLQAEIRRLRGEQKEHRKEYYIGDMKSPLPYHYHVIDPDAKELIRTMWKAHQDQKWNL